VNQRFRDYLAAAVGIVALSLGAIALVVGRVDFGVTFRVSYDADGDHIVIDRVAENSPGQRQGFEPGMVVIALNDAQLIRLPEHVCPTPEVGCEDASQYILEPATPTVLPLDGNVVNRMNSAQVRDLAAIRASDLATAAPEQGYAYTYTGRYYIGELRDTAYMLFVGALLLIVGSWWLATGRGGPSLRPIGVPLAVATALPFLMRAVEATWYGPVLVIEGMLVPFGFALLGFGLSARIEEPEIRGVARMASLGAAIGAMAIAASRLAGNPFAPLAANPSADLVWSALLGATVFLPGLAAAGPLRQSDGSTSTTGGRLLQSAELAAAGATPVMSLLTGAGALLLPLSIWLVGIAVAGRSTLRPLARLAMRAQLQRDLIVAATEAERARVAADIHDDALQELTLLVHRLDEAGDEEGAGIARTVSDRLRAICGDLRLPILDDLGVGPALDWLVLRIERLSGGEVRLERSDGTRPPADVELAFFRIAQEALGNAVKHGKPPIMVRYQATDGGASLSVDDAGPGIPSDAAAAAEREGRFGLLNMHQRAEAIGAILDIRRWPSGGTHVALEWRPH
jgi:signal transduction histidine kinase